MKNKSEHEFQRKIELNIRFATESYKWKIKLVPHVEFFLPIQCNTIEQMEYFLNEVRDVKFDGIALPLRNMSCEDLAIFLVYLYQCGVKKVHILGCAKPAIIAICAWSSHNLFQWVSLDSTSWRTKADHGEYYNPIDLTGIVVKPESVIENNGCYCDCKFCEGRDLKEIQKMQTKKKIKLIYNHNYLAIENMVNKFYEKGEKIIDLDKELKGRFIKPRRSMEMKNVINIISMMELYKNGDITDLKYMLEKLLKIAI
jgi:queuine/archaeosine tRNA-ribosyltransferase